MSRESNLGAEFTTVKGYEYRSNANLVLQGVDRRSKTSREPTGEAESLKGRMSYPMGDRAGSSKPSGAAAPQKKKRIAAEPADGPLRASKRSKTGSVLDQDELEGIKYQPKTRESRLAYDQLLNFVAARVGDQAQSVIMSAADEVLAVLKDEEILPKDKQAMLEELLSTLSSDDYNALYKVSQGITDYVDDGIDGGAGKDGDDDGIAVVFDDEDEGGDEELVDQLDEDEEDDDAMDIDQAEVKKTDVGDEFVERDELAIDPNKVDAYWLQRELTKFTQDAVEAQKMADEVFRILERSGRINEMENDLAELLGYNRFDFVKLLLHNRDVIVYCTKLARAQSDQEREAIETKMLDDPKLGAILAHLKGKASDESATLGGRMAKEARSLAKQDSKRSKKERELQMEAMELVNDDGQVSVPVSEYINLEELAFKAGGHLNSNKKQWALPPGSFEKQRKGYDEVVVPASKAPPFADDEKLVKITELPAWAQPAFEGVRELNRMQSKVYKAIFEGTENVLLCAPTGGGKTNCAMLAMLHEIGRHLEDGKLDVSAFKIVYIAPMKSLVQEMVHTFGKRLKSFGITVGELTGDAAMTKEQIDATQVIFTTPEKWDIITRKSGERTYTELVRLVIIDEIHLLHDNRGPVLESIVSRTIRQIESTQEMVRIMGLSATLPNYRDVGTFLRVKPENLFAFPNSYRPIPLEMNFIGITVQKPFKRFQLMNKLCFEKVSEHAGTNQVLVFVHSRKETAKTAKMLRDMAIENNTIAKYLGEDNASREILTQEAENVKSADLKELLPYGFAIHHAGMAREDRTLVEDLFTDKLIQVLVSTATLAWGVNTPAHAVIIKGTKVYNPEVSDWIELSGLDVMQMLGRAGRPGFDTKGEGVLITGRSELNYYLSLMNEQLPIESQYISKLADNLNAEIVLGTVQNVKEAVTWLGYSYLYVCMLRSPELYGVSLSERERDKLLVQRRYDLIHSAATILAKNNLIKYDRKSGSFHVTDLGRIASHYYLTPYSMSVYNENLKATTGDIELLRVFSLSEEFKNCAVRPDERVELKKLMERVPIPVKESIEEASAKINVLLQSYISRLSLEGFSLASDMVYVKQSAGRIMRALFEIALKRGWAAVAEKCLKWCIMIERRVWSTQSALRQFKALPDEIIKKLEKKDLNIDRLYDLDSHEIGEGIELPSLGKSVYNLVHRFPRLDLAASVQPITRSLLLVELTLTPDFTFEEKYHGTGLAFWVMVQDVDGDVILHHEMFILKKKYAEEDHTISFTVPLYEPLPPQYFVKVISDRWLNSQTVLPISFRHLILPEKYPPHTELLDLQPLPVAALKNPKYEALYKHVTYFNPIQTQTFNTLYNSDVNTLICAPAGSEKMVCAEFAMLREFSREQPGAIVCIEPYPALVKERVREWSEKFGEGLGKTVVTLTGEWTVDQKLLKADIVVTTPEIWDMTSRRWLQRKAVQQVRLFIVDELHLIGSNEGPTLEMVVSRIRYINQQLKAQNSGEPVIMRIVSLSTSLANAKDVGEWIGATPASLFNFHPNVRPIPLEVHMQGFDHPHFKTRIESMNKLLLYAVAHHAEDKPVIIWVPNRALTRQVARDLLTHANAEDTPKRYLHVAPEELTPLLKHVKSKALQECLALGVGLFHEAMTDNEREVVQQLFRSGAIQVVIATHNMAWDLHANAHLVVVMGSEYYDGKQHSYVDYAITDLLQMLGHSGRPGQDTASKAVIFAYSRKKEFFKKFIYEPLPIESHLDHFLHDHLNAAIVTQNVSNKQDAVDFLTWTFFYRRIAQNPNYYNLQGVTHRHISDHLSELIESTLNDLSKSRCIAIDENEMDVSALNLGMIAAYYYIRYTTIELFNESLSKTTKMRGLIEILSHATEFESLAIRQKEDDILAKLAAHLPVKITKPDYHSTATKVNILLQSYFSRRVLSPDLAEDLNLVLRTAPRLLQALVDVISSNGWFNPAIAAMELSQMIVQAMWDNDSPLKQLPHVTQDVIDRIKRDEPACQSIMDFLDLDDKRRVQLLQMEKAQLIDVARAANRYPNIEVQHEVQDADHLSAGGKVKLAVSLQRDMDEDEKIGPVHAPFYPGEKIEGWWLIVGDADSNTLYAIKKVTLLKPALSTALEFDAPLKEGPVRASLYLMSDAYIGCDQEFELTLNVGAGSGDAMDVS